ncbi:MAG: hypothetical protein CML47_05730 [Rhodobacteraceae bacterium]|nr:MAG: hypothetical protein CML47_05730 [Paracoccaceae bacterium]
MFPETKLGSVSLSIVSGNAFEGNIHCFKWPDNISSIDLANGWASSCSGSGSGCGSGCGSGSGCDSGSGCGSGCGSGSGSK